MKEKRLPNKPILDYIEQMCPGRAAIWWSHAFGAHDSAGRHAWAHLKKNDTIDIGTADKWCIVLGTHLILMYPELYEEMPA